MCSNEQNVVDACLRTPIANLTVNWNTEEVEANFMVYMEAAEIIAMKDEGADSEIIEAMADVFGRR